MEMNIKILPSYSVAYIRQVGPYGENNVQVMDKIKTFARNQNLLNDEAIILGITQDSPEDTKPEECRYDACLVISDDIKINDECIKRGRIIGGKYAIFTIDHTVEAVQRAWNEMFSILFSQGYQIDISRPVIERYAYKMLKNHKCEICVPIK